jgi:hypothetical protein
MESIVAHFKLFGKEDGQPILCLSAFVILSEGEESKRERKARKGERWGVYRLRQCRLNVSFR